MRNIACQFDPQSCGDMNKKIKLIAGALVLLLLLLIIGRYIRLPLLSASPQDAIPRHASLVLSCNKSTLEELKEQTAANGLAGLFVPTSLQIDLANFEKIFQQNFPIDAEKELLAALRPTPSSGFDILFILNGARGSRLHSLLRKVEGWQVKKSVFKDLEVFNLQSGKATLSVARYRNLLLFSQHAYLVENALSQLKSPATSLCRDADFKKVAKAAKAEAGRLHVLLNLAQISAEFTPLIEPGYVQPLHQLKKAGSWLHLYLPVGKNTKEWKAEFAANPEHPLLSANAKGATLAYQNAFRAIPDNLGLFWWLSVQSIHPAKSGEDWKKYFGGWVDNEVAFALGEPTESSGSEHFLLLKTKDQREAESSLAAYAMKMGKLEGFDFQMFKVQQFMGNSLSEMLGLGLPISNPYSCVFGEYVLFSNTRAGMERWLGKYIAGQTCSKSVQFLQSLQSLPDKAQGFVYLENLRVWQEMAQMLSSSFLEKIGGNPLRFNQLAATIKRRGSICEFTLTAPKTPENAPGVPANILWKAPLQAKAAIPPAIFQNPQNGEMQIFVQDKENRIYLISKSGRILWRRSLEEPIASQVYQLDIFNNKEGQFAFNTPSAIYVVDRTGADLAGFPLHLQTPATNGLTVIDFFKSKDYQFFIACENGNAYGFDENGSPVEGWRPKTGVGTVRFPLVHFQAQGMDFMILLNESGRMQVYQKNGTERFPPKNFESSFLQKPDYQSFGESQRIVTCNESGKVFVTSLRGETFGLSLATDKDRGVKFAFADVLGDERKDYIVLRGSQLAVYLYEGTTFKKGFEYQFGYSQDELFPVLWKDRKKAFIGTLSREKKQISLVDRFGRLLPQFPLAGTTAFQIVDLLNDGKPVAVSGFEENVIAYKIE